jgi:hypothetical protein
MKTTKNYDDGLEWLRTLRRKVAAKCGHDLEKQAEMYRKAAAKHSYKVFKGETAVVVQKKRLRLTA